MKLLRLSGWVLVLVAVIAGLTEIDPGPTSDPAAATVAVLRLVALAAAWYLLAATAVALVGGARRVRLVPSVVRWMVLGSTLVPAAPASASVPAPPPVMQPVDDQSPAPVAVAAEPSRTWTVRPGDHLWRVAERTLADSWGRPVSDAEVVPYWRQVVEANRPVLSDPDNPDLVFPGQQLTIPEPPAAPYVGRP